MWRDGDDDCERSERTAAQKGRGIEDRLLIADEVSDTLYRRVATILTLMECKDRKTPLTAYVSSTGGSADSRFAMLDLFRFAPCPMTTVANGVVAAMLIFLGWPQGRRVTARRAVSTIGGEVCL